MAVDLGLVSVGGVQRFVAESRKTVDVAGASRVLCELVIAAARAVAEALRGMAEPYGLLYPTPEALAGQAGVTNKIAFLAAEGAGPLIARSAAEVISDRWASVVGQAYPQREGPDTPGR